MQTNQSFVPLKASTRIGCWNVRRLGNLSKQNSRLRDVLCTMEEKKIELLALSDVRCPGHGIVEINGQLSLYSGLPAQQPSNRRKEVAVVLSEKSVVAWRAAGAEFDPISERLVRIRLKMHSGHVRICVCCVCTNE